MIKKSIKILAVLCALTMLFSFSACNKENTEKPTESGETKYYTITFNTNGGTPIAPQKVKEGEFGVEPEQPTREGMIFHQWKSGIRVWFFESNRMKEDVTLDAIWIDARNMFDTKNNVENGTCEVMGIVSQHDLRLLNIPKDLKGFTFTALADGAFEGYGESYAKKIVFPETVDTIGENALAEISEIELEFTGKIKYISQSSFKNCTTLREIHLDKGMTEIPHGAFSGCIALETTSLPEGIVTISENAYNDCVSLKNIILPSSLTTVENGAFRDCKSLKTVFFQGSQEQYAAIDVSDFNDAFKEAKTYFYSETEPEQKGTHWHYNANGKPIIWN